MATILWKAFKHLILIVLFLLSSTHGAQAGNTTLPPERYELCKTDPEILSLQQQYGLIRVSSTPTKAAMHPEWPETLISLFVLFLTVGRFLINRTAPHHIPSSPSTASGSEKTGVQERISGQIDRNESGRKKDSFRKKATAALDFISVVYMIISSIVWLIQFITIEKNKPVGGWISAMTYLTPVALLARTPTMSEQTICLLRFFITGNQLLQRTGTLVLVGQRWKGQVGAIAYSISSTNGCAPYNGSLDYLQHGARARAFRIIQTVQIISLFCYSIIANLITLSIMKSRVGDPPKSSPAYRHLLNRRLANGEFANATFYSFLVFPVLVYEIVVATKGRPVVISGNCMLVELDPKWGFYDSEIETWWKVLTGITGM
jgi:hypothetical protein